MNGERRRRTQVARARATLTRHFFASFFRLTFLDDAGEESFKRALLFLLVALVGAGLFVARLYIGKYNGLPDADAIAAVIQADRLFAIALAMWTTAVVTVLTSGSLYPDALDFRVLMALPIARNQVFLAKCLALARFVGVIISVSVGALSLPLAIITSGRLRGEPPSMAVAAVLLGATAGCWFVVAAVMAIQGVTALLVPRHMQRRVAIWQPTAMMAGLVLGLPFLLRTSALWRVLPTPPSWLTVLPPVWFFGLADMWLPTRMLATTTWSAIATVATAAVTVLASASFTLVYRRFDETLLRHSDRHGATWRVAPPWAALQHPSTRAVQAFISATVWRSGLHNMVCLMIAASGAALATSSLINAQGLAQRWVIQSALGVPFTLMAGAVVGIRAAFLLPANLRAGWIFRFAEADSSRPHQLNAVYRHMVTMGVAIPALLSLPLVAHHIGTRSAVAVLPATVLLGTTFVEALCLTWRRVPFTCTFLFAKRPPAVTFAFLAAVFGWFVFIGAAILNVARAGVVQWFIVMVPLALIAATLRWWRRQDWGRWPLEFEDYAPDGMDALRLEH